MNCDHFSPWPGQVWDNVCGDTKKGVLHCGSLCQIPLPGFNMLEAIVLFNKIGRIVGKTTFQKLVLVMMVRSSLIADIYLQQTFSKKKKLKKKNLFLDKVINS